MVFATCWTSRSMLRRAHTQPISLAYRISSTAFFIPVRRSRLRRCVITVMGLMQSSAAIFLLAFPTAILRNTSSSRGVGRYSTRSAALWGNWISKKSKPFACHPILLLLLMPLMSLSKLKVLWTTPDASSTSPPLTAAVLLCNARPLSASDNPTLDRVRAICPDPGTRSWP